MYALIRLDIYRLLNFDRFILKKSVIQTLARCDDLAFTNYLPYFIGSAAFGYFCKAHANALWPSCSSSTLSRRDFYLSRYPFIAL